MLGARKVVWEAGDGRYVLVDLREIVKLSYSYNWAAPAAVAEGPRGLWAQHGAHLSLSANCK